MNTQEKTAPTNEESENARPSVKTKMAVWMRQRDTIEQWVRKGLAVDDPMVFAQVLEKEMGESLDSAAVQSRLWQNVLPTFSFFLWIGETPDHHPNCVRWALDHGLAKDPPTDANVSALVIAAQMRSEQWLSVLLPYSNPKFKSAGGASALMSAIANGNEAGVRMLLPWSDLSATLSPLEPGAPSSTLLQLGAQAGSLEIVRDLWGALTETQRQQQRAGAIECAMSATVAVAGVSAWSEGLDFLACALSAAEDPSGHDQALAALLLLGAERLPKFQAQQERQLLQEDLLRASRRQHSMSVDEKEEGGPQTRDCEKSLTSLPMAYNPALPSRRRRAL